MNCYFSCINDIPRSGTLLRKWWKIETKINVCIGTDGWCKLETRRKYGVLKKIEPFYRWFKLMGIIGNLLRLSWKPKRGNRSGSGTLTSSTLQSGESNGPKRRILKLSSFTQSMGQNGVKSAKVFPDDQKTESRTDSIHTFKKTTTFWSKMRGLPTRIKCHRNSRIWSRRGCFRRVFVRTLFMCLLWMGRRREVKARIPRCRKIKKTTMLNTQIGWRKISLKGSIDLGWGNKLITNGIRKGLCKRLTSPMRSLIHATIK